MAKTEPTISEHEQEQIDRANSSGKNCVVFVHGLWLLPNSWDQWTELFEAEGYTTLSPGWPDDPETIEEAKENPDAFANKKIGQIADHYEKVISALDQRPAIVGHSFGGLLAQILAGRSLSAATVAIDAAPFRGILPLPYSALKVASTALKNPLNRHRAVALSYEQFKYGFANELDDTEAKELYEKYSVPGPGQPLFQAADANFNPASEDKVDTKNPDRGPLLLISGEKDHTVPPAISNAAFKREQRNEGVTELVTIPDVGHSLTIDHNWRIAADETLAFIERFLAPKGS